MPLTDHNNIELVPTTTKVSVPFMVVQKRNRPDNRGGIKQVYLLASLKTQRERRNVARGHPLPNATLAKRVSGRERKSPGRTIKCVTRQRP